MHIIFLSKTGLSEKQSELFLNLVFIASDEYTVYIKEMRMTTKKSRKYGGSTLNHATVGSTRHARTGTYTFSFYKGSKIVRECVAKLCDLMTN
jgi:hypothetical protein